MTLRIFPSELEAIAFEASRYPYREVGGDLYGLWSSKGIPIICLAVGPGDNYSASTAEYEMDIPYMKKCEKYLTDNWGLFYLGDWHSHHMLGLEAPSTGDQRRIFSIMQRNQFQRMAEIIVTHTTESQIHEKINAFVYYDNMLKQSNISLLAEHESPFRKMLQSRRDGSFIKLINSRIPINRIDYLSNDTVSSQRDLCKHSYVNKQGPYSNYNASCVSNDIEEFRIKI